MLNLGFRVCLSPFGAKQAAGTLLLSAILKKLSIYTKPRALMKQYVADRGWMGMLC